MAILTNAQAQQAEAYQVLGITPTLEGELLTLTFQNGTREYWGSTEGLDVAARPWVETLCYQDRIYCELPSRES
jgi:hypothetical protein